MFDNKKILVIASHPDDEILGASAILQRFNPYILILGKGRGDELDNQFDKLPLLHWVKEVEKKIKEVQPEIIFTHYQHDLNIDHRITYRAVITACRPGTSPVKKIYSFEVNTSTELADVPFKPNLFMDIDPEIKWNDLKSKYPKEMRDWPNGRSRDGIISQAQYRGMQSGKYFAEAYQLVREYE